MLSRRICPASDDLGVFLELLERLRRMRLDAKARVSAGRSQAEKTYYDAFQATMKILINSFYGYLGFAQARFGDFDAAEKVTSEGRSLLKAMIEWLRARDAMPVEIDTDGIYFVPPRATAGKPAEMEKFRREFVSSLPPGIELEFDGEYKSMFSYKMKNYALLTNDGEMIVKGAALKSRGLEPFQRSYLREFLRLKLEGKDTDIAGLKERYENAIRNREWSIEMLAKTETLQDSPANYMSKIGGDKRARSAVYELAVKSGRDYRAGDQISYYVTGEKKSVQVHQSAKLVSEWNPAKRDENVVYYLAKLGALHGKFGSDGEQGELEFGAE